jgi:hypothetical protein
MKEWLKQLLCKHKYEVAGTIWFKGDATYFLECMICGKRKIVKSSNLSYSKQLKDIFKMWKNKEIEINFEDLTDGKEKD